jgi:hypothetical protein
MCQNEATCIPIFQSKHYKHSSLPPVVCRWDHVLFTLLVFVWFVFTSSCLEVGSCLIYVISVCLVRKYNTICVGHPLYVNKH